MLRSIVENRIAYVNDRAPAQERQTTEADAPLLYGPLDSLSVVELLVGLEEDVEDAYGVRAELVGNEEVIAPGGPLETVGSLIRYLEEKADVQR